MALEVLYGPVPITVDGVAVANVGGSSSATWIQGLGLYTQSLQPSGGIYGGYAIQLDGRATQRNNLSGVIPPMALDLRSIRGLVRCDGTHYTAIDWITGNIQIAPFLTISGIVTPPQVVCADRFLRFSTNQVFSSPITDGQTFTLEYTFPSPFTNGGITVSRTGSLSVVCVAWGTNGGQVRFYDTVAKAQAGPTLYVGEDNDGTWYIPKWDIFVEMISKQIKVLANAIQPATLSAPVASPAVAAGYSSTLTTQLLGSNGEPCIGELIDWAITAGSGTLSDVQSVTDANGNATTNCIVPLGATGSVSVQASMSF